MGISATQGRRELIANALATTWALTALRATPAHALMETTIKEEPKAYKDYQDAKDDQVMGKKKGKKFAPPNFAKETKEKGVDPYVAESLKGFNGNRGKVFGPRDGPQDE